MTANSTVDSPNYVISLHIAGWTIIAADRSKIVLLCMTSFVFSFYSSNGLKTVSLIYFIVSEITI